LLSCWKLRAGHGIRTRDFNLGKKGRRLIFNDVGVHGAPSRTLVTLEELDEISMGLTIVVVNLAYAISVKGKIRCTWIKDAD